MVLPAVLCESRLEILGFKNTKICLSNKPASPSVLLRVHVRFPILTPISYCDLITILEERIWACGKLKLQGSLTMTRGSKSS